MILLIVKYWNLYYSFCKLTKSCGDSILKGRNIIAINFPLLKLLKNDNDYYHLNVKDSDNKK